MNILSARTTTITTTKVFIRSTQENPLKIGAPSAMKVKLRELKSYSILIVFTLRLSIP